MIYFCGLKNMWFSQVHYRQKSLYVHQIQFFNLIISIKIILPILVIVNTHYKFFELLFQVFALV